MRTMARPGMIPAGTLVLLTALYFAQGLPYGFFTQALPVVLRESGFSLIEISATGILFAPWALKFLWAPYVDHYGTRRQWLLSLQFTASAVTLGLACLDLSSSLRLLLVGIAVVNAVSATQDVATDGLAVQLLAPRQRGLGNGIQVGAYRIGMIVGGGALLWLFALAGWRSLFVTMAILLLVTAIPVWWSPRTPIHSTPGKASPSPSRLVLGWWQRSRRPGMVAFILLIGGFKFGDSMGSAMVGPFMSDTGLTLTQIALVKGVLSSTGSLAGAALGGWLCYRHGRRRALLIGGVTQTTSLALYLLAALGIGGFELIVTASLAEHILGGAATVAVFTLMMDASDPDHAGSDYTLLACAVVTVQGIAGFAAGTVGELLGYPALFGSSLVLSGIGCAALIIATDRGAGPAGVHAVWAVPDPATR